MSALTFTPGKFYRTRDGRRKIEVIATGRNFTGGYSIMGLRTSDAGFHISSSFTADGRLYKDCESPGDLIAEWKDAPEVAWPQMPEGSKSVFYSEGNGAWIASTEVEVLSGAGWSLRGTWLRLYPQHVPKWSGDWRDSLVTRPTEGGK